MSDEPERVARASSIRWVRVDEIHVSQHAQRDLRPHMAERIAAGFDPDKLGVPVLNHRHGRYWVIDGQHRIEALKIIGYDDQLIECQVYDDLDERAEAEMFLGLNTKLSTSALDKFLIALTAQRRTQLEIARVVDAEGLSVGRGKGAIGAVTALERVYGIGGAPALGLALRIIRDAFGDSAMRAELIEGMGLVAHRYNGQLEEERVVARLSDVHAGANGVLSAADVIRRSVGRPRPHCVAAAIVDALNAGRGGKKLANWWA